MRALLLVLDSVGIGGAPDAAKYGDEGANTLGHILEGVPELRLSNLESLGLRELLPAHRSYGFYATYKGSHGRMQERSAGKDTTTGHWEIAGVILEERNPPRCRESVFLDRLYDICTVPRQHVDEFRIGRVIAPPLVELCQPGRPKNLR